MSHILIVDDHEQDLYLLKSFLTGNGHQVVEAHNGVEALGVAVADTTGIATAARGLRQAALDHGFRGAQKPID